MKKTRTFVDHDTTPMLIIAPELVRILIADSDEPQASKEFLLTQPRDLEASASDLVRAMSDNGRARRGADEAEFDLMWPDRSQLLNLRPWSAAYEPVD